MEIIFGLRPQVEITFELRPQMESKVQAVTLLILKLLDYSIQWHDPQFKSCERNPVTVTYALSFASIKQKNVWLALCTVDPIFFAQGTGCLITFVIYRIF